MRLLIWNEKGLKVAVSQLIKKMPHRHLPKPMRRILLGPVEAQTRGRLVSWVEETQVLPLRNPRLLDSHWRLGVTCLEEVQVQKKVKNWKKMRKQMTMVRRAKTKCAMDSTVGQIVLFSETL